MDHKFEDKTEQEVSSEADRLRASAEAHKKELKEFWITFATTGVIIAAIIAFIARGGLGWFVSNTRVGGASATISAAGQIDFALATVGSKNQGAYDSIFHLSDGLSSETIDGKTYYIASGNSSFRVDSDKNLNNYLANADLRPGNRGTFDLYVICRTDKRDVVLRPVFSAWYETGSGDNPYKDAFSEESTDNRRIAAEFLKGHILLFTGMDDKGMYSGNIDFTKDITINLSGTEDNAYQVVDAENQERHEFRWGECIYSNGNTAVYRLSVYWVWPEQFGNFIYTGNSYNKNLFTSKDSWDYTYFISVMESSADYRKFFSIEGEGPRPDIDTITSPTDYQTATENYELYSGWYNAADEKIGELISYIELGFEIAQTD